MGLTLRKVAIMLSFNFIPCKEYGTTKSIPQKNFLFFFKRKDKEIFIPSKKYIVVNSNKTCPAVIAHPSMFSELTTKFFALGTHMGGIDVICDNGIPISYTCSKETKAQIFWDK